MEATLTAAATSAPLSSAPLARFLRPADPQLSACHDALWDLKHALALQSVFVAGVCRRAREVGATTSAEQTSQVRASKTDSELIVGIIGGGVLGGVIGHALVDAGLPPSTVLMSTRTPKRQKELTSRGVCVVFDNETVARCARLLIIAVLPGQQLQEVAKTAKIGKNTLVLSLVGGTPLPKVRSLLGTPSVIAAGADTTLPLLIAAQAQRAIEVEEAAEELEGLAAVGGRLPDEHVLRLSAEGFACDVPAIARVLEALTIVLDGFEFPPAIAKDLCLASYYGRLPPDTLSSLAADLAAFEAASAAGAPPADDERFTEVLVRARAAFEARCLGGRADGEEVADGGAPSPSQKLNYDNFDDW